MVPWKAAARRSTDGAGRWSFSIVKALAVEDVAVTSKGETEMGMMDRPMAAARLVVGTRDLQDADGTTGTEGIADFGSVIGNFTAVPILVCGTGNAGYLHMLMTVVNVIGHFMMNPIIGGDTTDMRYLHAWVMVDVWRLVTIMTMLLPLLTKRGDSDIFRMIVDQACPMVAVYVEVVMGAAIAVKVAMKIPDYIKGAAMAVCVSWRTTVEPLLLPLAGRTSQTRSRNAAANPRHGMALALTSAS